MALINVTIVERILGTAMLTARRRVILTNFLLEGLDKLENMSDKDICETCASYTKRHDGEFLIILTPIQKMRMWAIVLF